MGQSAAEVRHGIEQTRAQMSETIDAIADRASPRRAMARQRHRMADRVHGLREAVMGRAHAAQQGVAHGVGQVSEGVGHMAEDVRQAPEQLRRRAGGNPVAAGLIAFGGGMLAASIIPSNPTERQAAARIRDETQPAIGRLEEASRQLGDELRTSAKHAADDVAEAAKDSAQQLADEVRGSAKHVQQTVGNERTP